jgi:hypothetical protein
MGMPSANELFQTSLVVGPDEYLAVRLPLRTSMADYQEYRDRLEFILPDEIRSRVVVLCCEEFAKVTRGELCGRCWQRSLRPGTSFSPP